MAVFTPCSLPSPAQPDEQGQDMTLSGCEYTYPNGRFVAAAKKAAKEGKKEKPSKPLSLLDSFGG